MCSGCSGDYEGYGDGWAASLATSRDEIDDGLSGRTKAIRRAVSREQKSRDGRNDTRKRGSACERRAESAYEVLVSAEEIIEIHRIVGHYGGAS
jgi:hypothetical protein